jgi:hypothetical protein
MADVKIDTDYVLVSDAESTTGWDAPLTGKVILETDIKIQGNSSIGTEAKTVARYELQYDMGAGTDLTGKHIMMWIFFVGPGFCSSRATAGVTVRVQDTSANIGDWYVGGNDTAWVGKGWKLMVVDVDRPFDENNGTDPTRSDIQYISATVNVTTAVGKGTAFAVDIMRYGTRFELTGGSGVDPITFDDVITKDVADDTYFGIVQRDKNGNIELNGKLYIGDPSGSRNLTTVFQDTNETVVFSDNPVASGYYEIYASQVDGSSTQVRFGEAVSSGTSLIGSKGLTVYTDETELNKSATSGWVHKPNLNFLDTLDFLGLYSLQTRSMDDVFLGSTSGSILGSNIEVVDSNFNDIYRFEKNVDSSSGTANILRNKVSFAREPQASFNLIDSNDIFRSEIDIIQSAGFINVPSGNIAFRNISYDFTQFLEPFITIDNNETWNVINPTWTIQASGQDQLEFIGSGNNQVNEKYDFDFSVSQPDGTAISGANIWIGETTPSVDLPFDNRLATDGGGEATTRYLQNTYTPFASGLSTNAHEDTFVKVYFYTRLPFNTSAGTVQAAQDFNVTLVSDGNIDETDQATAITDGSGITVTRDQANPFAIIGYASGNGGTINTGDIIAGVTSNASGVFIEQESGDTTAGKILLENIFGDFVAGEEIDIITGGGTWDDANFTDGTQQEFTWGIDGTSLPLQTVYDYLSAKIAEPSGTIDSIFQTAIEWGEDENSLLFQAEGGDTYKTERTVRISEGVIVYNRGGGDISQFTADDGTTFTPPQTFSLTLTNLKSDSEVRVYEEISGKPGTELAGTESSSTSFQYTYTYGGSDVDVIVVIFHLSWLPIRLFLTLSNADQTIPIQQTTDRVYENP